QRGADDEISLAGHGPSTDKRRLQVACFSATCQAHSIGAIGFIITRGIDRPVGNPRVTKDRRGDRGQSAPGLGRNGHGPRLPVLCARRGRPMSVGAARVLRSVAVLIFGLPATLGAHDIPSDLTIRAFLKPEGQQLHLLIRVPLQAMRDIDYPRRAREYVDLARADQSLRDAANTWILSDIELYEGEALLTGPTLVAVRASLPSDDSFRSYETALARLTGPRLAN